MLNRIFAGATLRVFWLLLTARSFECIVVHMHTHTLQPDRLVSLLRSMDERKTYSNVELAQHIEQRWGIRMELSGEKMGILHRAIVVDPRKYMLFVARFGCDISYDRV